MKCNCPYYEIDIQAQKETEQMEPPFFSDPPDADPDPPSLPEEENTLAKCGGMYGRCGLKLLSAKIMPGHGHDG